MRGHETDECNACAGLIRLPQAMCDDCASAISGGPTTLPTYHFTAHVTYSRPRIGAVVLGLVAAVASAAVIERAARIYLIERSVLTPVRGTLEQPIDSVHITGVQEVQIPAGPGMVLAGWYVPSRTGAAVILLHGTTADRSTMLAELRILANAGIGVLAYDSPGHGLSSGAVQWGANERSALSAAVSWLRSQPDVDSTRLGAAGFSYGGYILAEVASHDERLTRVALLSTPTDGEEVAYYAYRRWSPLAGWFALRVDDFLGFEPDTMTAVAHVAEIAPRPLLIIAGDSDTVVPMEMSQRLAASAGRPKELFLVRGAGHGKYMIAEPERYARKLIEFFGAPADVAVLARRTPLH
jgi:uncharacterized protein